MLLCYINSGVERINKGGNIRLPREREKKINFIFQIGLISKRSGITYYFI